MSEEVESRRVSEAGRKIRLLHTVSIILKENANMSFSYNVDIDE